MFNLNTANRQHLKNAGLRDREINNIEKFLSNNEVFVDKRELKKHGIVSEDRYDRVKDNLQASRQNLRSPYNERVSQQV